MKMGLLIGGLLVAIVVVLGLIAVRAITPSNPSGPGPGLTPNPSSAQVVAFAGQWRVR